MLRLALTGGLASGKSTVAAILRQRGIPVADADRIAHELLPQFGSALAAAFGEANLTPARLAELVFADSARLAQLNAILHPPIMARVREQLDAWSREGHPIAALDAALLLEANLTSGFDQVIVVTAESELRIARFMARTGLSREQTLARMAHQMPDADKVARADFVIVNNGSIDHLTSQVETILLELR